MRVEYGGLTDVETGGVSGLEDELVMMWSGVESRSFCDTDRPAFLERDLVGLCVDGNW